MGSDAPGAPLGRCGARAPRMASSTLNVKLPCGRVEVLSEEGWPPGLSGEDLSHLLIEQVCRHECRYVRTCGPLFDWWYTHHREVGS